MQTSRNRDEFRYQEFLVEDSEMEDEDNMIFQYNACEIKFDAEKGIAEQGWKSNRMRSARDRSGSNKDDCSNKI